MTQYEKIKVINNEITSELTKFKRTKKTSYLAQLHLFHYFLFLLTYTKDGVVPL